MMDAPVEMSCNWKNYQHDIYTFVCVGSCGSRKIAENFPLPDVTLAFRTSGCYELLTIEYRTFCRMLQVDFACIPPFTALTVWRSENSARVPPLQVHVYVLYLLDVQGSLEAYRTDRVLSIHC